MLFYTEFKHYGFLVPGVAGVAGLAGVAGVVPLGVITVPFGVGPGTVIVFSFGLAGIAGVAGVAGIVPLGVTVVSFGLTVVLPGRVVLPGIAGVAGVAGIVPLGFTLLPGVTVLPGVVVPLGVLPGAGLTCAFALFIAKAKNKAVLIIAIFFIKYKYCLLRTG